MIFCDMFQLQPKYWVIFIFLDILRELCERTRKVLLFTLFGFSVWKWIVRISDGTKFHSFLCSVDSAGVSIHNFDALLDKRPCVQFFAFFFLYISSLFLFIPRRPGSDFHLCALMPRFVISDACRHSSGRQAASQPASQLPEESRQ